MPSQSVLVTTPTGNVGSQVLVALLGRGLSIRAALRDPEDVPLPESVERVRFDFEDPRTYAPALAGIRAFFLLRPGQITNVGQTLVKVVGAAEEAGVKHCVFLSVSGAESQPWLPHRKVERALEASRMSWTFLRANHFMQNLLGPYRPAILRGQLALPAGDGRVAFVDCADLGVAAAQSLAHPGRHAGMAYTLTGGQAVSLSEVAETLSRVLGRDVRYRNVSPLSYFRSLRRENEPLMYAAVLTGIHLGVRRGSAAEVDHTLEELLHRPPTTLEEFVVRHRGAFEPAARAKPSI